MTCGGEDVRRAPDAEPGQAPGPSMPVDVLGLRFEDATLAEAADRLIEYAAAGLRRQVFFVNAHCVNVACRDRDYHAVLSNGRMLFADGLGMAIAARLWGVRFRDNVNGTDLFPLLCERAAASDVPMAFLGAQPGIAERCAERMRERFPGLRVVWTHHGYYPAADQARIVREINRSGAALLLVAKGVPRQELWIARHGPELSAPVLMGVGALFDFYSGAVPRCPARLRELRMEWLFRLLVEPRRLFGRYVLGNPLFLYRVIERRVLSGPG